VLNIPVLAVLQYHGKYHVTKKIEDQFVQTDVELGVSNEKYVEVLKGLNEGDIVAMSPISLMSDEEKRTAFGSGAKGGKKDWGEEGGATADAKGVGEAGAPGDEKKVAAAPVVIGKVEDPAAKAKPKGKGAGAKGKGAGRPAFFAKLQSLSQEERTQLRSPDTTEAEKSQLYKKAGLTDAEIDQMAEMRKNFGGGGGGFGGGPGGGGRRGGGGGPPGGGDGSGGSQQ
jgi:HlyD family secretion protein